ncbi:Cytoskeleton-associated protein 2 [Lonchura striata]|uniref:Cytoskeleton-associated protein 2 n=1 Tax=Lonchura striata TaxID=40157 RepID=A0A218UTG6_9PASE|nr:cytoskeleton-associated protein 2 isoform X2 [Lonchura striata domestica]OWK56841.1 Cytoskeleton-associated protein 2 [Lonchura striata domestica]
MAARAAPQLPAGCRSEPAFREQRRQKVEEYLSRKKTFSGVPIQENQTSISSRTRRATTSKLQDKLQLSTSPKAEMENKENADKVSWDQSTVNSETNVTLNSSTVPLTSYVSGTNCNLENQAPENKVIDIKSQHVPLSKAILEIKTVKERHLTAEKQNASKSVPKKPALGRYRGKVIQSKINSFWKAAKTDGEKSSLPDKKLFPSATKQAANSLSMKSCNTVLKTIKVANNPKFVKSNGDLPFHTKPSDKAATNSQSGLKKQLTFAVAPKKVTVSKVVGGRRSQPLKAASFNPDSKMQGVKKSADARQEVSAKSASLAPGTKSGQNAKMDGKRKSILPKESAEERRARLDEWRASRGKVMRRPPIYALLGPQSKSEEQEFSAADTEKVNKTLSECLQLIEQGHCGDEARAMLEDLIHSFPGVKKLAKYWICCMRLEQTGHLGKLIAVYEEAVLAGAMPREELRHTLVHTIKNTEGLLNSDSGGAVTEAHFSEVVEVSKEPNLTVELVQETFKDLCPDDDQKEENDNKKAETSSEVIKKEEIDLDLKQRGEILPKKNKKRKAKERAKKKGKCEREQKEEGIKNTAQAINSPEKENDTSYSMRCNPPTTPYLESVKMHPEANDCSAKDLKIVTPLRYSQRIREKMFKLPDAVKEQDPCVSSLEQLGDLEPKATVFIHRQSNALQETSAEIEE